MKPAGASDGLVLHGNDDEKLRCLCWPENKVKAMSEPTTKRGATTRDTLPDAYELADQIAGIRAELQSLASTVSRIANNQRGLVQDKAMETANQVEDTIRQNPLSAMLIALGLGFLFGVLVTRR